MIYRRCSNEVATHKLQQLSLISLFGVVNSEKLIVSILSEQAIALDKELYGEGVAPLINK